MEQNIVIYIGTYKALGIIAALVAIAWRLSRRLARVETKVDLFEHRLTNMEGKMEMRFTHMEGRLAHMENLLDAAIAGK